MLGGRSGTIKQRSPNNKQRRLRSKLLWAEVVERAERNYNREVHINMEKICSQCGAPIEEGATRCRYCKTLLTEAEPTPTPIPTPVKTAEPVKPIQLSKPDAEPAPMVNIPNSQPVRAQSDAEANKVQAILAYLGFLVLIPIFAARESHFARFHANQGLVLFLAQFALGIVQRILFGIPMMGTILSIVSLVLLVFAVMGIISAVQGEEKPLPLIGEIHLLK